MVTDKTLQSCYIFQLSTVMPFSIVVVDQSSDKRTSLLLLYTVLYILVSQSELAPVYDISTNGSVHFQSKVITFLQL